MPRNGAGTYSLPNGTAAISNQPIASAPYNAMTTDVANALTQSLSRDGSGGMLADLSLGGFNLNSGNKISGKRFIPTAVTLSDLATIPLDASLGMQFFVNSTHANPTISVPTNPTSGQIITIFFSNTSGGNSTLALSTAAGGFLFGRDIPALTSSINNSTDVIQCIYVLATNSWWVCAYTKF